MESKTWPMLLDMTKEECKKTLRSLELSTYSKIVSVLRAQGELTKEKRKLLSELQSVFSISVERHRAEIRRAVNDEMLNTIAETLAGPNTNIDWTIEGRRLIPLMPRVPPQVSYTALATRMAQLYCGINAKMPDPCDTAMYGKMEDIGADYEMTDSEEETDGLRYITESMIPQQFNADQGPFTTLPLSQARIAKEKLKEKKEKAEELTEEVALPQSPPILSSSMSSGSSTSSGSQGKAPPSAGVAKEKRKRKRSLSNDHPPPHSPPPPPLPPPVPPTSQGGSAVVGGTVPAYPHGGLVQTTGACTRQISSISPALSGSSMKITVTGGMTRSTSALPISSNSQQKVILVSTSAASGGTVGSIYQRSISVPILKSTSQTTGVNIPATLSSQVAQNTIIKGSFPPTSTSVSGSSASVVNKLRPRFASSISSSILSQGSSTLPSLPPRPPQRQRSNSLILQTEIHPTASPLGESTLPKSTGSSVGQNSPERTITSPLSVIGSNTLQLRPSQSIAPKSNIQVKQDGGKVITHAIVTSTGGSTPSNTVSSGGGGGAVSSMVGSRFIGRSPMPSSSQGLYVVSTSSGMITVVTRTVASAAISNSRVVTVNTLHNSKSSVIRAGAPSAVVSMGVGQKTLPAIRPAAGSIRPVMSGAKSNVIVVHKGAIAGTARPVGIQGLRDMSAKIITKPSQGLTGSATGGSGILSGTLVVKPSPGTSKGLSSIISTKDPGTPVGTGSVSSSVIGTSTSCVVGGTVSGTSGTSCVGGGTGTSSSMVAQFTAEMTPSTQSSSTTALASMLHTTSVTPSCTTKSSTTGFTSGAKNSVEGGLHPHQLRKESHVTAASSSHDISTVSASSSLPSTFRGVFPKSPLAGEREEDGFEPESSVLSEEDQEEEDHVPLSNLVSSSSDAKAGLAQREDRSIHNPKEGSRPLDPSVGDLVGEDDEEDEEEEEEEDDDEEEEIDEEEEEDNEWLKLGLEDEEEMELEDEEDRISDEDRLSDSSSREKGPGPLENEADGTEGTSSPGNVEEGKETQKVHAKAGCSEESVSSSTGPTNEKDGELQMLVEKAVEVLQEGDPDQARSLLYKAGFELIDSSGDPDHGDEEGFSISNIAGVSSSSAMLCSETPLSSSTPLQDDSSLGSMSELDPTTGYFYSPSAENSSEPTSNKADSPASKDEDSLPVPDFEDNND